MTRMRKERPTMRIDVTKLDPVTDTDVAEADYATWRMNLWYEPGEPCLQIREPMPPIRCTMPVPCGVCWYCLQHEARK